eukprot:6513047-Prymnesium_polylepis.1
MSGCLSGQESVVFLSGTVVGCEGSWTTAGIAAGGIALCSSGWHVCASDDEVASLGLSDCSAAESSGAFFATEES